MPAPRAVSAASATHPLDPYSEELLSEEEDEET